MQSCDELGVIKTIRCIVCPTGCEIEVKEAPDGEVTFEGYTCKRGLEYAKQEFYEPKRILTTTIRVENGFLPLIPVRTDKPILKNKLNEALKIIAETTVKAPIKLGDIIIENITGEEANIIASRDLVEQEAI
jgi:CxxC motif-containing protein